ncbi:MAG TPA: hypothetical protein VMM60_09345, partial [Ilumatobacter sp.]|nr:hypothetical protein [Ilumatobacter sp.]
ALVSAGISPIEALITHAATGQVPRETLQATRGYSDAEWGAGIAAAVTRGTVTTDGSFTATGSQQRQHIESITDVLGALPYQVLTDDEAESLRAIGRVVSARVVEAGLLPGRAERPAE